MDSSVILTKGRATHSEFWYFLLFFILAYVVVWLIDHLFLPYTELQDLPFGDLLPGGHVDNYVGITVLLYRPIMAIPTAVSDRAATT